MQKTNIWNAEKTNKVVLLLKKAQRKEPKDLT